MFLVPMTRGSSELSRSFDRLFDDSFDRFFGVMPQPDGNATQRSPALDVAETDRVYTVTMDLPGVAKEDVKVTVEGRRVSVQASSRKDEERKDGDRVLYRERSSASYARSFTLPVDLDPAESGARLEQGVLTLTLPKKSRGSASNVAVR